MTRDDLQAYLLDTNVRAFLRVVRGGESSQDDSAYTIINGGTHFEAPPWAHPWHGIPTTQGARASGAYQFLGTTWARLVEMYGFPDFSPACQDQGAVALIAGRGALPDVLVGAFDAAVVKCRKEWTSLPGASESNTSLAKAREVYERYGGLYRAAPEQPEAPIANVEPSAEAPYPQAEQPPAPVEDRTVEQPEKTMSPFAGIALKILSGIAPDLAPILSKVGTPGQNDAIAEQVIQLAQKVTATNNAQAAAEKIQTEPAAATAFRQEVSKKQDEWLGTVTRLAEFDETSRAKAREFATAGQRVAVVGRFSFIEFLSLLTVSWTGVAGTAAVMYGNLSPELKGAIVTLMIVGGFTTVLSFWFGSSLGSMQKNGPQKPAER